MVEKAVAPVYSCECGSSIPLGLHKVGDVVDCAQCQRARVIIRSKIQGNMPDNFGSMRFLSADERVEVNEAFKNIVQRRVAKKTGQLYLVKSRWVFLLGLLGPYMAGFLAMQNLSAVGKEVRGKRVFLLSSLSYIAIFGALLALYGQLSPWLSFSMLFGYTFFTALGVTLFQVKDTLYGFEKQARAQFPLVPTLIAVAVALGQGFLFRALFGLSSR
jgi:hypothetical protein